MPQRVLLAEPRGFCAGVEMAIKALTWMVQIFEPPVFCYHEIVHNAAVVEVFERAGVVFFDDITNVPPGRPVMLSAHGSAPDVVAAAEGRAAIMIDAVCPLVTKVHHEVRRMADQGHEIIYVGHEGHDEAVGVIAEAPGAVTLVDPEDDLDAFRPDAGAPVALLAQTTLGLFEWQRVLDTATRRHPGLRTPRKSDLCYATTNRQSAVQRLAEEADVILVVGSANSSNTQALVRVATMAGVPAHRVDGPGDIDASWIAGAEVVGVTAGASAPDRRVRDVIDAVAPAEGVVAVAVTAEGEYFPLPPQLRRFLSVLEVLVEGAYAIPHGGVPGAVDNDRDWGAMDALDLITP